VDGFLLALLLVAALATGGRDQRMVAHWSDAFGRSGQLLALAVGCACLSAALMAWIGAAFADLLPPRAAQMLVPFALVVAAAERAWPARDRAPQEPTRSLAAIGIVLLARQVGDSARLTVFALAAWSTMPSAAGLGGALGGAAAVALGWAAGAQAMLRWPLRPLRLGLAVALGLAALFIGMDARFAAL